MRYPERDLGLARRTRDPMDRIVLNCLKFASAVEKRLFTILP